MVKQCRQCSCDFKIGLEDLDFYRLMDVPPPTFCYFCRMIRRLSYRNERFLYNRECDFSGKKMISCYSTDKIFPVYDNDVWWSDQWDALEYGREYDFSRSFFEQFFELRDLVPRMTLIQQEPMENSKYCNCASYDKNCYLVFSSNRSEDCSYGSWINASRDCIDCLNINNCELCYECVSCRDSYNLLFCRDSNNCRDSIFLRNCISCKDCIGCDNLANAQFCIFNEQKTEEEYFSFKRGLDLGSRRFLNEWRDYMIKRLESIRVKYFHGTNVENSVGDYMRNSRNLYYAFECDNCEDLRYCMCLDSAKNCMDYSYWGLNAERLYEVQAAGYDIFNLRFCNFCWSGSSDLTYCDHCFSSKNCFGCVGLKRKEYCILNKQYSKEEYFELVPRIIEHMKRGYVDVQTRGPAERGSGSSDSPCGLVSNSTEWGEFFPINKSIYAYNETLAMEQNFLTKEEVLKRGWLWKDEKEKFYTGEVFECPDHINNVEANICDKVLICEKTKKPYKIMPSEYDFYKKMSLPIPKKSPDQRHLERMELKNLRRLYDRSCGKCGKKFNTTYEFDRPEKVYCEECYLGEMY